MHHKDHTQPFRHARANDKYNEFVLLVVFKRVPLLPFVGHAGTTTFLLFRGIPPSDVS